MSKLIFRAVVFGILLCAFSTFANAQSKVTVQSKDRNIIVVGATETLEFTGKVAVIVVKGAAKVAWKTIKFTAGELAAPIAKAILLKATPKVSLFLLKTSGKILEKAAPIVLKMAIMAAL